MEDHIINSWAIRAYWTMFTHDEMTLFSNKRLCENIGFDGTGVHCNTEEIIFWENWIIRQLLISRKSRGTGVATKGTDPYIQREKESI